MNPKDYRRSRLGVCDELFRDIVAKIKSTDTPGRRAFTAAHECCHYLKDRREGPLIENLDAFIDEPVSSCHPREIFAQTFAACLLMLASKVRAIIEREFGGRRLTCEQALFLKRHFDMSTVAMLSRLKELGLFSAAKDEEWLKLEPETREKEVFGGMEEERRGRRASHGKAICSDRFKLIKLEVQKKDRRAPSKMK
jgi:Zn-dependent peptidase ImmA (M78 family)